MKKNIISEKFKGMDTLSENAVVLFWNGRFAVADPTGCNFNVYYDDTKLEVPFHEKNDVIEFDNESDSVLFETAYSAAKTLLEYTNSEH